MPYPGTPLFVIEGLSAAEERHTQATVNNLNRARERSLAALTASLAPWPIS
jgi:hypothetical protein